MNKDFIDEQLAAGKTMEEIEELLWDSPESDQAKHDKKREKEDEQSINDRGY